MSALPTREEIAEIIYEGWKAVEFGLARAPKWKDLDKKTADGFRAISDRLLTRLRPAFESYEAQVNHYINRVSELVEDCDALRASLARKDEALRACAEALAKYGHHIPMCKAYYVLDISEPNKGHQPCSCGLDAALASRRRWP